MEIREKLRTIEFRLVELANFLNVSRPTLYKYLELYENKNYGDIDKKCYDLFVFIDTTKNIKRTTLMSYLINTIVPIEETVTNNNQVEIILKVKKLTASVNEDDVRKIEIIKIIMSGKFDHLLEDLINLLESDEKITMKLLKEYTKKGKNK